MECPMVPYKLWFQMVDQGDQLTHSEMGMRPTWIFFSLLNDAFLHMMKLPVSLQFHDTENDNCIPKIYHMFMLFMFFLKIFLMWTIFKIFIFIFF